jgi:hypothetical protein
MLRWRSLMFMGVQHDTYSDKYRRDEVQSELTGLFVQPDHRPSSEEAPQARHRYFALHHTDCNSHQRGVWPGGRRYHNETAVRSGVATL